MDRTRKATWGFLSGLAFAGMTVIIGLTATPLLVRWLGPERFGAFRAASDWTGHLTICTLVPMRSVPHRVVCVMGLDDGTFPRQTAQDGDDELRARGA